VEKKLELLAEGALDRVAGIEPNSAGLLTGEGAAKARLPATGLELSPDLESDLECPA